MISLTWCYSQLYDLMDPMRARESWDYCMMEKEKKKTREKEEKDDEEAWENIPPNSSPGIALLWVLSQQLGRPDSMLHHWEWQITLVRQQHHQDQGRQRMEADGAFRGWDIMSHSWGIKLERSVMFGGLGRASVFILLFVRLSVTVECSKCLRPHFVSLFRECGENKNKNEFWFMGHCGVFVFIEWPDFILWLYLRQHAIRARQPLLVRIIWNYHELQRLTGRQT